MSDLTYNYTTPEGHDASIAPEEVFQHMKDSGLTPTHFSDDGSEIYATDDHGKLMKAKIADVVNEKYGKLKSVMPNQKNVDYDGVDSNLRTGLSLLPDDDQQKHDYIKNVLSSSSKGMKDNLQDGNIVGSGDDFYIWNKEKGKWSALTNKPGLDMSDVGGAVGAGYGAVGTLAGGLYGGIAGGLPGMMAGSAAGGQAAKSIGRTVQGWWDPEYKKSLEGMSEEQSHRDLVHRGIEATIDGVLPGAFHAAGQIPGVKQVINNGIASTAARVGGSAMDLAGAGVAKVAKGLNNPTARAYLGLNIPYAGGVVGAADLARAPAWLTTKIPEYAGKAATWARGKLAGKASQLAEEDAIGSGLLKRPQQVFPDGSSGMSGLTEEGAESAKKVMQSNAELLARQAKAGEYAAGARKAGNIADTMQNLTRKNPGAKSFVDQAADATRRAATGEAAGEAPLRAADVGRNLGEELGGRVDAKELAYGPVKNPSDAAFKWGQRGQEMGHIADRMKQAGDMGAAFVDNGINIGLKGAQGLGNAGKFVGKGLNAAGRIAAPIENRVLTRQAVQSQVPQLAEEYPRELIDWYNKKKPDPASIYGYSN